MNQVPCQNFVLKENRSSSLLCISIASSFCICSCPSLGMSLHSFIITFSTINPRKKNLLFQESDCSWFLSKRCRWRFQSQGFHRFLLKRSIPKLAGEQSLPSKSFIHENRTLQKTGGVFCYMAQ